MLFLLCAFLSSRPGHAHANPTARRCIIMLYNDNHKKKETWFYMEFLFLSRSLFREGRAEHSCDLVLGREMGGGYVCFFPHFCMRKFVLLRMFALMSLCLDVSCLCIIHRHVHTLYTQPWMLALLSVLLKKNKKYCRFSRFTPPPCPRPFFSRERIKIKFSLVVVKRGTRKK